MDTYIINKNGYRMYTGIVNRHYENGDIYIGRGTKWGNPFRVGIDGTRDEVISKYKDYVLAAPLLMKSLNELAGKILMCSCRPLRCHGDVLKELLEENEGAPDQGTDHGLGHR